MAGQSQQHKSAVLPAYFSAWQQWARWGSALPPVSVLPLIIEARFAEVQSKTADSVPPDWAPVARVVAAYQSFAQSETTRLQQLLDQSDQRLAPLSDPLRLSMWNNRWLDLQREREESYTDWLAWLLQELGSAEAMLKIFGLDGTEFGTEVRDALPKVFREVSISTSNDENKRLDLVIRFGEIGILLVEVKVRSIEEAGGSGNLKVYLDWLKSQEFAARYAVLLVPESIESPCGGWDVRDWEQVGLQLRAQAVAFRKVTPNNLLLAASLLCFAGAVEQNVLGLDGAGAASAAPQTALYLETFLAENQL